MAQKKHYKKTSPATKKPIRGVRLPVFFLSLAAIGAAGFGIGAVTDFDRISLPTVVTPPTAGDNQTQGELTDQIQDLYQIISDNFFDEVDSEALYEGALSGMVQALGDPYSQFLNVENTEELEETINSSFEGIGAEIMSLEDQIVIVSPIKGSPAEKAGLLPNDVVLSADGEPLAGMTATDAVKLIRGEKGTPVLLEIERGNQTFEIEIVRDTIPIETVTYQLDEDDATIGMVAVHSFARPTYEEMVHAITDLRSQGAKKFVFDFRQNPGGLLDQSLMIGNMFVEDDQVLLQIQNRDNPPQKLLSSDREYGDFQVTEPSVMLVDEGSASASEIVAGILQESAGIPLVGATTFGKGTVQSMFPLSKKTEVKLTIDKWLTPDGNWIHDEGITPDYEVALPDFASLTIIDTSATFELGAVSEAVLNVEKMLEAVGFDVVADGFYDEQTVEAMKAFQEQSELEPTGTLTDNTAVRLVEQLREVLSENDTQYQKAIEVLQNQ